MEIKEITSMISALGFPIVMCLIMTGYIKFLGTENDKMITQLVTKIEDLVKNNQIILEKNNMILNQILNTQKENKNE